MQLTAVRRLLRPARARWQTLVERADPARVALRRADGPANLAFACVYRAGNAPVVRALLDGLPAGAAVRLWSLDAVPDDLAAVTVGTGPGTRFALLNRLIGEIPPDARQDALVLCDDDVRFLVGDAGRFVALGRQLGLDLFQPSHSRTSFASLSTQRLVRKHRLGVARVTGFVEQGPLIALSPRAQGLILPLPEDTGMGWGVDVRWARLAAAKQLTLGVVDAAVVVHLAPPAGGYDTEAELARTDAELRAAGVDDIAALQTVQSTLGLAGWIRRRDRRPAAPR